jgi:hypothetical protein
VELQDVLADDVERRRPELVGEVLAVAGVAEGRVVVEQRVEPDVEDVLGVPRHGDAPGELRPRQRHVVETAGDERQRLVVALARLHEVGLVAEEALEIVLEAREPEEPVVLLLPEQRDLVDRARVVGADLVARLEVRAPGAVPALVGALVHVPVVVHALEDLLDADLVPLVRRPDEEVVGDVEQRHERTEALGVAVGQLLR